HAAELAVERVHRLPAARGEQSPDLLVHFALDVAEPRMLGIDFGGLRLREIVADGVRQDEVAVGEPLHERARSQPVRAVVGEVRLADGVTAGERGYLVVVISNADYCVLRGGVN